MAAALIAVMRFAGADRGAIAAALETLTGESHGDDWFEWICHCSPLTMYLRIKIYKLK